MINNKISSKYKILDKVRDDLIDNILYHRGIINEVDREIFFKKDYILHDPFLLKDMNKAVERILKAINNKEKILIYSDYDADGVPGGVIMHDFFKKINYENFSNYIPHRHHEGFGLNLEAIDQFIENGVKVIITVDCGIADTAEVEKAQNKGIDVIITDHHEPGEKLPKAFAIINPKQEECKYPEKMLCGSGVAFKLICALIERGNFDLAQGWEKWLLDMVGIATLSDMVPLKGENRVLAGYGLKVLRKSKRLGLVKILNLVKIEQENLAEEDITFLISPRINAASRMGVPMDAFRLLSTTDDNEAEMLSKNLDAINKERKTLVAMMTKEAKKTLKERAFDPKEKHVICIGDPSWKPALVGLVANSLLEEYGVPTFVWGKSGEGEFKGSCRSGSLSVVDIMNKVEDGVLIERGGHDGAGGFSVEKDKIHFLEKAFLDAALKVEDEIKENSKNNKEENNNSNKEILVDSYIDIGDINTSLMNSLDKLSPYGFENRRPIFIFPDLEIYKVKFFGNTGNCHLELTLKNSFVKALMFFADKFKDADFVKENNKVDIVGVLENSYFRGMRSIRIRIVDILPK